MPNFEGHEPELNAPLRQVEQPALHEELGPDLDGMLYWTKDANIITDQAVQQSNDVRDAGKPLPVWAKVLQQRVGQMRSEARPFQTHLIEDSEQIDHAQVLDRKKDITGSIKDWYRRLGPTNEAVDLIHPLLGAVDTLEQAPESIPSNLLIGNILQDIALRTEDHHDKVKVLKEAKEAYQKAEQMGGIKNPDSRAAFRHNIDCSHQLLAERYSHGEIDEDKYYLEYEKLQKRSADALIFALDDQNGVHVGDGEALEWASLLFARHRFWSHQNAEQMIVRSALLREDQAIYPWRAENGMNPIWSFDSVVTDQLSGEVKTRIQLKNGVFDRNSERDRVYLPTVVDVVRSEVPTQKLRGLIRRGSKAIISSYEAMRMSDQELASRIQIDQGAIDEIDKLFNKVLA